MIVQIFRILVIIEETVEFQRHEAFQKLGFVEVFQLLHDLLHIRFNLFFVDIHILHFVDHVEKLFFTYLKTIRNELLLKLFVQHAFDILDLKFFLGMND